jgi:hypothetical protein
MRKHLLLRLNQILTEESNVQHVIITINIIKNGLINN